MQRKDEILRTSVEVLDSIAAKSVEVRDAATALTDRIVAFEKYLAKLKGRVETECYGPHPMMRHTVRPIAALPRFEIPSSGERMAIVVRLASRRIPQRS